MISAGEPQEFTPFGRIYLETHPGDVSLCSFDRNIMFTNHNLKSTSNGYKVSNPKTSMNEKWFLFQNEKNETEELYWKGNHVVWSKYGGAIQAREVISSFTVDFTVKYAMLCRFSISSKSGNTFVEDTKNDLQGDTTLHLCILHDCYLETICENGEHYVLDLQFQVQRVWSSSFGLIFERIMSPFEKQKQKTDVPSIILSLMHPLDEVAPVIIRNGTKVQYATEDCLEIVYIFIEPNLCVLFDHSSGLHSIAKIRHIHCDDIAFLPETLDSSTHFSKSSIGTPVSFTKNSFPTSYTHTSSSPLMKNVLQRTASPFSSKSHTNLSHSATLSKCQSPSNVTGISRNISPVAFRSSPSHLSRFPHSDSALLGSYGELHPLPPDLCLDILWNESLGEIDKFQGKASKAFISNDCCGNQYLCLLKPCCCNLCMIRLEFTYDRKHVLFGKVTILAAHDAVPLHHINMIVILEESSLLTLYTGNTQVAKIHIPGVFFNFSKEFASLAISGCEMTTPVSTPIPKRSSIISSTIKKNLDVEAITISPVSVSEDFDVKSQFEESTLLLSRSINSIKSGFYNGILLEATDMYWHLPVPKICHSSLVNKCLESFQLGLPRDISIMIYVKWYIRHNALGIKDCSLITEWHSFLEFLGMLLGYNPSNNCQEDSSEIASKKARCSEEASNTDWEYLLNSKYHSMNYSSLMIHKQLNYSLQSHNVNIAASLANFSYSVLSILHLLYEEFKLNTLSWSDLQPLANLLYCMACDLKLEAYQDHYWRDYPSLCYIPNEDISTLLMQAPCTGFTAQIVPSIFSYLFDISQQVIEYPFPYIPTITERCYHCIMIYSILFLPDDVKIDTLLYRIAPAKTIKLDDKQILFSGNKWERVVLYLSKNEITLEDLETFPPGVSLPVLQAFIICKPNPPCDWPSSAYKLVGRYDLAYPMKVNNEKLSLDPNPKIFGIADTGKVVQTVNEDDGMEDLDTELLSLRFNRDHRIHEVCCLLRSSHPVRVSLVQRPDISDHDFIEEQEKHLYNLCIRTMALCVGRGMFTLSTSHPLPTEPLPVPKLCLTGRVPPRNLAIDLTHIDVPPNMNLWPQFHNGVAAGLRVASGIKSIGSHWIVFNKPKDGEMSASHAGVLMGLGLMGHLENLTLLNATEYLIKMQELTSVALLLGISASKRTTMDSTVTRMLSLHIEALLPPSSTELDVPHNVQVAAILGIGLLYQGSAQRHMTEVLLNEIGRPPGPEMENSCDRESYSLAAGLALGLVNLGHGKSQYLSDLSIPDRLYQYMVGQLQQENNTRWKERFQTPNYQIKEGDFLNVDVTCPGATLALGLIFFNSGNRSVANWMEPPSTQFLLDFSRPDFLLLMTISKGLILWESVLPSSEWIESHIPSSILPYIFQRPDMNINPDIDFEAVNQAYCNILAGACFVLGLHFAGSADENASTTLLKYTKLFISLTGRSVAELSGKSTIETCLNVTLLALSLVMCGTGDLEVLRICRHLRNRIGQSHVGYGSHMAVHMALGLLFLGSGHYTLSTSKPSIAAMLCAFFPKFPIHSNDNRYHLQAFRHLYVLATEQRLLLPTDALSGKACYANLTLLYLNGTSESRKAPCLLPELHFLQEIILQDSCHWSIVFRRKKNWNILENILKSGGTIAVQQKEGKSVISHILEKFSFNTSSEPTLTESNTFQMNNKIYYLSQIFFNNKKQIIKSLLQSCLTKENLEVLPIWIALYYTNLEVLNHTFAIWNIVFLDLCTGKSCTVDKDLIMALKSFWLQKNIISEEVEIKEKYNLAIYLILFDLRWNLKSCNVLKDKTGVHLQNLIAKQQISPKAFSALVQITQTVNSYDCNNEILNN